MTRLREKLQNLSKNQPSWGVLYWIIAVLFLIPLLTVLYSLTFRLILLLFPSAFGGTPAWLSTLTAVVILASCFLLAIWSVIKMWKMSK